MHGYYEYIWFDTLTDEELDLARLIRVKLMNFDPLEATQASYVMLLIRERRLLQRQAWLRELGEDEFVLVHRGKRQGHNQGGPVELATETGRRVIEDIMRLEDRLNSISGVMGKVIDQLGKYERRGSERHTFDELFAAIERSAPMTEKDG